MRPPTCRLLRCLLLLALCAWAAFAVEAVAGPLRMLAGVPAAAVVASTHAGCASMTGVEAPPVADHAGASDAANGHAGCCTQGACCCTSAPGVLVVVIGTGAGWSGAEVPTGRLLPAGVLRSWPASLLRPPIG